MCVMYVIRHIANENETSNRNFEIRTLYSQQRNDV